MKKILWLSAADYHQRISRRQWLHSLGVFLLVYLPLCFNLPDGFGFLLLLPLLARFSPSYRLQALLAWLTLLAAFLYIAANLMRLGFTTAFIYFLTATAVAKMLESRNPRDRNVLFLIQLLLLLATLMYSRSALVLCYLFAVFGASLYLLVDNQSARLSWPAGRHLSRALLQALPLAVLLFFLFPRIAPLWAVPQPRNASVTGLGDQMSMGDLASLAQSDEVVFRVKFDEGLRPEPREMYWRGPVLWHFDGLNWTQRPQDSYSAPERLDFRPEQAIRYDWFPVKRDIQWLTGLDVPVSVDAVALQGKAFQLRLPEGRDVKGRYGLLSILQPELNQLDPDERRDALRLPRDYPQTRALAQSLRAANGDSDAGFAQGFLNYLAQREFYYSLEPPPGMGDVEQFLFSPQGHIGFCEHYANALAIAARTVGIPARVITGYQGGERNALNGYWTVREENAHAWTELYIDGRWQRFDPTAAVAPYRIEAARLSGAALQRSGVDSRSLVSRLAENVETVSWLRAAWDASNAFWQEHVVNYGQEDQDSLLQWLGLERFGRAALGPLLVLGVGALLLLAWLWQRRRPVGGDRVERAARVLLARLERRGLRATTGETLAQLLRRGSAQQPPERAQRWQALARDYERYRYYEQGEESALLRALRRLPL